MTLERGLVEDRTSLERSPSVHCRELCVHDPSVPDVQCLFCLQAGPGMESDVLEQIFDPFFTTKGKKGTGLGLSVIKTIVEAHRGTIECQSTLEKGTTFVLRLPVQ